MEQKKITFVIEGAFSEENISFLLSWEVCIGKEAKAPVKFDKQTDSSIPFIERICFEAFLLLKYDNEYAYEMVLASGPLLLVFRFIEFWILLGGPIDKNNWLSDCHKHWHSLNN